jgi:hypothetical protein
MILVAGPYRSGTNDDPAPIAKNVATMTDVSLRLFHARSSSPSLPCTVRAGRGTPKQFRRVECRAASGPAAETGGALSHIAAVTPFNTFVEIASPGIDKGNQDPNLGQNTRMAMHYCNKGVWSNGAASLGFAGLVHIGMDHGVTGLADTCSMGRWDDATGTWLPRLPCIGNHGYDHTVIDPTTGDLYRLMFGVKHRNGHLAPTLAFTSGTGSAFQLFASFPRATPQRNWSRPAENGGAARCHPASADRLERWSGTTATAAHAIS